MSLTDHILEISSEDGYFSDGFLNRNLLKWVKFGLKDLLGVKRNSLNRLIHCLLCLTMGCFCEKLASFSVH